MPGSARAVAQPGPGCGAAGGRSRRHSVTPPRPPTAQHRIPGLPSNGSARPHQTQDGKLLDVVALSNLCVDIVVNVDELPPHDLASRRQLLRQLTANSPGVEAWEVGGSTNLLIAASRLGLKAGSVGHVGQDVFGAFLEEVLAAEGIRRIEPVALGHMTPEQQQTLLCFVLVNGDGQHAFCSRYDMGPWPMLEFVRQLPPGAQQVLESTRALFVNGEARQPRCRVFGGCLGSADACTRS